MADTRIEWADRTWNPITGCTKISEACQNCYAERMAKRLAGRCGYPKANPFQVVYHSDKIDDPLRWRKPSRIFVCSMGDLFHEDVPEQMIGQVWNHMRLAPWHIYMILTKRPERMKDFFIRITNTFPNEYPAPYIWLGVTAENQQRADERIPILLQTPAAKRFVSIEPMLGPVDIARWLRISWQCSGCKGYFNGPYRNICPDCGREGWWSGSHPFNGRNVSRGPICPSQSGQGIDWVICGGETGPGARPMHPDWVRSLRGQCKSAEVPFFFKQWGEWTTVYPQGLTSAVRKQTYQYGTSFYGIDKKTAGRSLDGRIWNQYPEVME
jgi:protein gp37